MKVTEMEDKESSARKDQENLLELLASLREQVADLEKDKAALHSAIGSQEAEYGEKLNHLEAQLAALKSDSEAPKETAERQVGDYQDELAILQTQLDENERRLRTVATGYDLATRNDERDARESVNTVADIKVELAVGQGKPQDSSREGSLKSHMRSSWEWKDQSGIPVRSKSFWRELDDCQKEISQLRAERDFLARKIQLMETGDDGAKYPSLLQRMFPFWDSCRGPWD